MNVEIIEPCGYSKTLSNLLNVASRARYEFPKSTIVLLGSILNGEQVKKELFNLNINIVDIPYEGFSDYLKNVDKDTIIITSPYGTESKLLKILKRRKLTYYDATSPSTIEKEKLIKKARFGKKIIFVGNLNTIEENYLAASTRHNFFFYDLSSDTKMNNLVLNQKLNKSKTQIIYQSEIANDSLSLALHKIKTYLPKATINHEISDENYEKKKTLLDKINDGDALLIVTSTSKSDKYLLEYYHLNTKNILYATIKDVPDAMKLKVDLKTKMFIISDGSVSRETINKIWYFFKYKGVQGDLLDQQQKSVVQNL